MKFLGKLKAITYDLQEERQFKIPLIGKVVKLNDKYSYAQILLNISQRYNGDNLGLNRIYFIEKDIKEYE